MPLTKLKIKKARAETSRPDASAVAAQERETDRKELVMKRLRKAKDLELSPQQQEEMAVTLCNETRMKETYFRHLSQCTQDAVEEVRREKTFHRGGIRNTQEQNTCMNTIHKEVYRVKALEVKLAFRTLRTEKWQRVAELIHRHVKTFEYGAFHAAIIIGDTVLEWNDSSLVIPRRFSETEWAFWSTVHTHDRERMSPVPVRANDQETNKHFECIIEKIEGIRQEKELLIQALVEMAVCYNTKLHYGVISNNCQHFAKDCLSAIGKSGDEKQFEGKVGELVDLLIKGGAQNTVPGDFATHEELNSHVMANLEQMTEADMEYCLCLYHLFHAFKEKESECSDRTCQEKNLEEALERKKTSRA